MALDPQEFKRKREEKKLQQQLKKKKMVKGLLIAGGILAVCAALTVTALLLIKNSKNPDPDTSGQISGSDQETVPPTTEVPKTVIHFTATGDLNVSDRLVNSGGMEYDFSHVFLDVGHLLADADLATVNFEGNLCGAPYGSTASAPQGLMQTLKNAGVDMLQLANSYAINRGVSGLLTTIDGVRQAGIEPVGVFKNQEQYQDQRGFTLFEVQGVRVAVVAFTKGMEGTTLPPGNEDCVNVLYSDYDSLYQKVNKEKITTVLHAVNQAKPDVTIALLHWGSEYNDTISKSQKSICNLLLENGVDAIIGTHPHYVQQIKYDPAAGTLIAYSLGDFYSDSGKAGSEYSIILDLEITKDHTTGKTSITGYNYTPVFSVVEEGKPVRVMRIREAMTAYEAGHLEKVSKETYEAMQYALKRIEARVAGE